jgi:hypothetical protein
MRTIACAFALLFALAAPASAQMHVYGGGHGGGGYHGYHGGMGGFHGGHYGGGEGFHEGFVGGERHNHHGGFWRGGVWYACPPWMWAEGMCGADY